MSSRSWRLRMGALLAGGSFAVHQLRFSLAYGSHSSAALAHQGHAYLTVLAPLVIGVLMLAAAEFAGRVALARRADSLPSLKRLWPLSAAMLLGVYCVQELAEGFLSSGHAQGFAGVFGGGGWLSVPLAIAAGLLIALLMRGAVTLTAFVAARRRRPLRRAAPLESARPRSARNARPAVLLAAAGPRAPPLASA